MKKAVRAAFFAALRVFCRDAPSGSRSARFCHFAHGNNREVVVPDFAAVITESTPAERAIVATTGKCAGGKVCSC